MNQTYGILSRWIDRSFLRCSFHSFVAQFVRSFVCVFLCSFVRSFICSLSFRFVSFCFVSLRFVLLRFVSLRFASLGLVSLVRSFVRAFRLLVRSVHCLPSRRTSAIQLHNVSDV